MSLENHSVNTNVSESENVVARVALKLPPFWKSNPTLWFAQLEAQFTIAGITVDATKFYHVISVVESDILNTVSDIILNPTDETNKYAKLKERLINLHSESEESKIRSLLQGQELGDQRPSQLLSRMRSLAGSSVGEPLLKSLWLSRLPSNTQSILTAIGSDLPQLATIADKISDLSHAPSVYSATRENNSQISILEKQISQLTEQVNNLSTYVRNSERPRERENSNNRYRRRSQSRNRQYKEPHNNYCFYHTNFGTKARKCKQPCSFKNSENLAGDR